MSQINVAFGVPMLVTRMENCEPLNKRLRDRFVELEGKGTEYANSERLVRRNAELFESKFTLFDWPFPEVGELRDWCFGQLYALIRELNGYTTDELRRLHISCESWFHLTRKGGFFGVHNHPLHSWSGVYCVRHDGDDPESDSGRLVFPNPNLAASQYVDMATLKMKAPFALGTQSLRLEAGQLVLFPSWLLHEVLPYTGDTERITVAFNAKFRMEGVENTHKVG